MRSTSSPSVESRITRHGLAGRFAARRRCEWCGHEPASPVFGARRACSVEHAHALADWWSLGPA